MKGIGRGRRSGYRNYRKPAFISCFFTQFWGPIAFAIVLGLLILVCRLKHADLWGMSLIFDERPAATSAH
jgi:hypothetical protein